MASASTMTSSAGQQRPPRTLCLGGLAGRPMLVECRAPPAAIFDPQETGHGASQAAKPFLPT